MTEKTVEAVQQTLDDFEALVIASGQYKGAEPPQFSDDGKVWSEAWMPTAKGVPPQFVRVKVYRRGFEWPTTIISRWDEVCPQDPEWRELWLRKPTIMFGSSGKRAALRSAFRDIVGDRRGPDEEVARPQFTELPFDVSAALASAASEAEVRQIHERAKAARLITPQVEIQIRRRLYDVQAEAPDEIPPAEEDIPQTPVRRVPQDHKVSTRPQPKKRSRGKRGR